MGNLPSVFICMTERQWKPKCGLAYDCKGCQQFWNPFRPRLKTYGPISGSATAKKFAAASELFLEQRTCCPYIYFLKRSSAGEMESAVKLYSPGKEQKSKLVKCLAEWALLQKFLIIMTFWFDLYFTGKKLSVQKLATLDLQRGQGTNLISTNWRFTLEKRQIHLWCVRVSLFLN